MQLNCIVLVQFLIKSQSWHSGCSHEGLTRQEDPHPSSLAWLLVRNLSDSMFGTIRLLVQSPSGVWPFATPWTAAHLASLSLTIFRSLPKFMFNGSVMPSSHLILWCLLLLSIFPSIRDFSGKLSVYIRWPKYWSFSFSISQYSASVNIQGWSLLWLTALISLLRDFQESSPVPRYTGINSLAFCFLYGPALTNIHDHMLGRP